jgi:DNA-directed RNA polymerases I, II, and III subunit RPABC1
MQRLIANALPNVLPRKFQKRALGVSTLYVNIKNQNVLIVYLKNLSLNFKQNTTKTNKSYKIKMNLDFLTQCGKVKRTSVEMMKDRGYDVTDELWILDEQKSDLSISLVYLKKSATKGVSLCTSFSKVYYLLPQEKSSNLQEAKDSIAVYFLDRNFDEVKQRDKMVSTEQFKSVLREYSKQKANKCLLIVVTKLSPQARKEASRSNLGIMLHDELKFNVSRHCMVPKHTGISKEDAAIFFDSRKLSPHQLPLLRESDPIAKYYGYPKGTLVQIERPGWIVYRVVGSSGGGENSLEEENGEEDED